MADSKKTDGKILKQFKTFSPSDLDVLVALAIMEGTTVRRSDLLVRLALMEVKNQGFIFEKKDKRKQLFSVSNNGNRCLVQVRARIINEKLPQAKAKKRQINPLLLLSKAENMDMLYAYTVWSTLTDEIHFCLFDINNVSEVGREMDTGYDMEISNLEKNIEKLQARGEFAAYSKFLNVSAESDIQKILGERRNLSSVPSESTHTVAIQSMDSNAFRALSIQYVLAKLMQHGYASTEKRGNSYLVTKEGESSLVHVRAKRIGVESKMSGVDDADIAQYEKKAEGLKVLFGFAAWIEESQESHICIFELKDIAAVGKAVQSGYNLRVAELEGKIQSLRASGKFAVYERIPNVVSESDLQGVIDKAKNSSPASSASTAAGAGGGDSGALDKNGDKSTSQTRDWSAGRKASDSELPGRTDVTISRIIRDNDLSRKIKEQNDYACQLCGTSLDMPGGKKYAEAHHIQPLGKGGRDIPENMICVCPNCHALLDYRAIKLPDAADIGGVHVIEPDYIRYHNREVDKS